MAYSELIKNFEKIREYMRDFYVYGFRTRADFDKKSARSYDDERRRVESWLSEYMSFHQDASGKSVFLSVDNRTITHNPLYKAFKTKSFTDKDAILHFYILDILADGKAHTFRNIVDTIAEGYLFVLETDIVFDDSTVRNKLKEYVSCGLLKTERDGKELLYSRTDSCIKIDTWKDALAFSSEIMPLGVVGSCLLDKFDDVPAHLSFKHHYLLDVLDGQVMYELVECRRQGRKAGISVLTKRMKEVRTFEVFPLKIYCSAQNGRQYLLAYAYTVKRPRMYRLDHIRKVVMLEAEENGELYDSYVGKFAANLWGASSGNIRSREVEHVELVIRIDKEEQYVLGRLEREKRNGTIEKVGENTYCYSVDVYDAQELLPWVRTFIGRIEKFECSNKAVSGRFYDDLAAMQALYGGGGHGIS